MLHTRFLVLISVSFSNTIHLFVSCKCVRLYLGYNFASMDLGLTNRIFFYIFPIIFYAGLTRNAVTIVHTKLLYSRQSFFCSSTSILLFIPCISTIFFPLSFTFLRNRNLKHYLYVTAFRSCSGYRTHDAAYIRHTSTQQSVTANVVFTPCACVGVPALCIQNNA
jgi:hypothetical protein